MHDIFTSPSAPPLPPYLLIMRVEQWYGCQLVARALAMINLSPTPTLTCSNTQQAHLEQTLQPHASSRDLCVAVVAANACRGSALPLAFQNRSSFSPQVSRFFSFSSLRSVRLRFFETSKMRRLLLERGLGVDSSVRTLWCPPCKSTLRRCTR